MPLTTLSLNKKSIFKVFFLEKVSQNQKIANKILTTHLFPSKSFFCYLICNFIYNGKILNLSFNNLYYKIYKNQILLRYSIIESKFISGAIHFLLKIYKLLGSVSNL